MKHEVTIRSGASVNMVVFGPIAPFELKVSLISYKSPVEELFDRDEDGNVIFISQRDEELCLQGDY